MDGTEARKLASRLRHHDDPERIKPATRDRRQDIFVVFCSRRPQRLKRASERRAPKKWLRHAAGINGKRRLAHAGQRDELNVRRRELDDAQQRELDARRRMEAPPVSHEDVARAIKKFLDEGGVIEKIESNFQDPDCGIAQTAAKG